VKKLLPFLLIFLTVFTLSAQDPGQEGADLLDQQYRIDALKNQALDAVGRGAYAEALELLDVAIALDPDDPFLRELRQSVRELSIIAGPVSEVPGVDTTEPDFTELKEIYQETEEEPPVEKPDFAEELFAGKQFDSPEQYRDAFRTSLGFGWGNTSSVYLEDEQFNSETEDSPSHPFLGINGDLQYFLPAMDRVFGINFRYKGVLMNPDGTDMLLHQADMAFLFRGFFVETPRARTILGLRFGVSLLLLNKLEDEEREMTMPTALTFGLFYSDPILRYIFKNSRFAEKLIMDLSLDFYYMTLMETTNLIEYSFGLNYQISKRFRLGVQSQLFNTSNTFQSLSTWDVGMKLTYLY